MKISRTLSAHDLQCIATVSFTDVRTVRSFLVDPLRVRSKCAARITMALIELGVVGAECAPVHLGASAVKAPGANG